MAAFVTQNELTVLFRSSLKDMIQQCRTSKKAPKKLVELVKHNLFAKYVVYNDAQESMEFGVNESTGRAAMYPTIKIYDLPLNALEKKLESSMQPNRRDQEFYAKLFSGKQPDEGIMLM
jgi:plasmid rolling circle replication initiator protein Rep